MFYEQKRFHSADTKYYADLNQICAYLKFEVWNAHLLFGFMLEIY